MSPRSWALWLAVGVLLVAAVVAWHDLGTREVLGRDENATLTKLDQPNLGAVLAVTRMKVTGQPGNMQPLYFLLQHLFWPLVGRSAFMLRFLPSAFGLLAVAFSYKLGQELWSRPAGLAGALLVALLPLHLRYSQIARPYTLLALWSLASAYFLLHALRTNRPWSWLGFVATAALGFYTHFNTFLVLAAEGLFAAAVGLTWLVAVLRGRESPRRLVAPVVSFLALGALCLPGLWRLLALSRGEAGGEVVVTLSRPFFTGFLYGIGLTSPWLRGAVLGLMALGVAATLYRRRWQTALFVVLWLGLPFVVLSIVKSPRPFVERYLIFVPPVALLLSGEGMVTLADLLALPAAPARSRAVQWAALLALTAAVAILFAGPLQAYYRANRAEDRLDQTLRVVERHARPGDLIVVSPRFLVRTLRAAGADVLYLTEHLSEAGFEEALSSHLRAWILYTSYLPPVELQEPLDRWVQARPDQFVRVPIKSINALAYHNRAETDRESVLRDRIALLEELAGLSEKGEAWQRYGILADAYEDLSALYDQRGELSLAQEYQAKADAARSEAPPP